MYFANDLSVFVINDYLDQFYCEQCNRTQKVQVIPRFILGSLDSKSRVLIITPLWDRIHRSWVKLTGVLDKVLYKLVLRKCFERV